MDANGQRFWLLADARHFPAVSRAVWDPTCRVLRLASERTLTPVLQPAEAFAAAQAALERVPRAIDPLECVARWDAARSAVIATSHLPDEALLLPLEDPPRDLCAAPDGVLYVALPGRIRLHDLRGRWGDDDVLLAGFDPWRLASAVRSDASDEAARAASMPQVGAGVWALERSSGRVARLAGRPLRARTPQPDDYDGHVFRPSPENGCAPQLTLLPSPEWEPGERAIAIAAQSEAGLALLGWRDGNGTARVRRWIEARQGWSAPLTLQGAHYAYALAWLSPTRIALRVPGRSDAPAFDLPSAAATDSVSPLGEIYPLSDNAEEAPFANGSAVPPHYPSGASGSEPLYPLSLNQLARRGEARNFAGSAPGAAAWLIDSNDNTTVWHRLFAEAGIPAHTGFVVWLAAGNEAQPPPVDDLTAWHAHGFGRDVAMLDDAMRAPQLPHAVWEREASELPGHAGLLGGERQRGSRGLFSVLVQNSRTRVRQLVGRYLWLRVVLHGDGRVGPEIAALRAWGSRFSYVDHYLPRIYRESLFGAAATAPGEQITVIDNEFGAVLDAGGTPGSALRARLRLAQIEAGPASRIVVEQTGSAWQLRDGARAWWLTSQVGGIGVYRPRATPADFGARMLANFEGVLTQLEDRVAASHLLSDPASVPDDQLEWLAAWIGVAFDSALPEARRRNWLRAAPDLARLHGTRHGLRLALDLATGGAVRGGEIVVIEDFRLRRILATLLGVDLVDEHDPLLPGLHQSGNSIVGDTLFVGDRERVELLALFREEVTSDAEDDAVLDFHRRLAHRATVLVHREVEAPDFALIRRIAQLEAPAHVQVRVAAASWPLLVGVASLVGVDTWLGPPRLPRPVQVNRSALGIGDFLIGAAVLDPRLAGTPAAPPGAPPVADAGPDMTVAADRSFTLDGSASRAAPGRSIDQYRWRLLPPDGT